MSRGRTNRKGDAGVTLIEMMVVLVIIAVVAALVVPNVIGRADEARVTAARVDIDTISASLALYRLDNGRFPTTEQGLSALVALPTVPPVPARWAAGGYLDRLPDDPWGRPYLYSERVEAPGFLIMTLGADGVPGGEGTDADIRNATP
jgi:general secretion pathway protein G